jgi:hypothetical protein
MHSQDVEQVMKDARSTAKQPPVEVTGSIGANSVFYQAQGIAPRRDPFYWVLNANLNFNLFNKISVPFSAVVTQQDKNFSNGLDKFSQPFNQFGISPKYKWLTVHAGYRTLEFSEYSLSGAMFLGGGVEIMPDNSPWSGTALYGRFVKAVPKGGIDGVVVSLPAYERKGGGAKLSYSKNENTTEFSFMKLSDDIYSIPLDTDLTVNPQENEILSLSTKQTVLKWLSVNGEFSYSMFTKNLYAETSHLERFTYVNQIYTPRTSSQFNKALNIGADFSLSKYRFGLKYKRIDPDYKSLGAIFLTNDVEELSASSSFALLKNKLQSEISAGVQRNNLDQIQVVTTKRIIGSLSLNYTLSEKLNLGAGYSNFSSNTLPVRDAFNDSIRFVQLTQSGNFNSSYSFGSENMQQIFTIAGSLQESTGTSQQASTFYNAVGSYNLSLSSIAVSCNLSFIYNRMLNGAAGIAEGAGPQLNLRKGLLKNRLSVGCTGGVQRTYLDGTPLTTNTSGGFNINYSVDKRQSVRCDINYIERASQRTGYSTYKEYRANLGYIYTFAMKTKSLRT